MNGLEANHPSSKAARSGDLAREALEAMTSKVMGRQGLLEKTSDADLVRETPGFATARLVEFDVGGKTGAA